jgi:hypothetical protein
MQTTDSSNLFKSDAELLKEELRALKLVRTKTLGEPVQLSSKPLCMELDGDVCWTGESGFVIRKIDLKVSSPVLEEKEMTRGERSWPLQHRRGPKRADP